MKEWISPQDGGESKFPHWRYFDTPAGYCKTNNSVESSHSAFKREHLESKNYTILKLCRALFDSLKHFRENNTIFQGLVNFSHKTCKDAIAKARRQAANHLYIVTSLKIGNLSVYRMISSTDTADVTVDAVDDPQCHCSLFR